MRIIAGKNRGKKLIISQDDKIRPTTDRAKEVMFNVLEHHYKANLTGNVLDAFAGSGALGIEALSRGAEYVLFLDCYNKAKDLLFKNLKSLPYIQTKDYDFILTDSQIFDFSKTNKKFDLVFLDAPYDSQGVQKTLANILAHDTMNSAGIFVIESNHTPDMEGLQILQSKKIGKTILFFCTMAVS